MLACSGSSSLPWWGKFCWLPRYLPRYPCSDAPCHGHVLGSERVLQKTRQLGLALIIVSCHCWSLAFFKAETFDINRKKRAFGKVTLN